ncbi:hypothetical protein [Marinactinospora rubrisoli]|uniref:Uncharacterized protein n=1 Tax=Marinactinospora rubrisoli TaxID=2715399 RepID=A0ABW2KGT1_9ACTN
MTETTEPDASRVRRRTLMLGAIGAATGVAVGVSGCAKKCDDDRTGEEECTDQDNGWFPIRVPGLGGGSRNPAPQRPRPRVR